MYSMYRRHFVPNYTYRYPSYGGYGSSFGRNRRWNYGGYNYSPFFSNYGRSRRRPYYWERDRTISREWRNNRPASRDRSPSLPREDTPPPPPKPEVPKDELVKELHVKDMNDHIEANTKKHRTDEYACTKKRKVNGKEEPAELVVRRGDTIKITLTFDRPYNKEKNDLLLCFSLGENPNPARGTKAMFEIDESGNQKFKPDEWGATLKKKTRNDNNNEEQSTILVYIPANCIIGNWNFYVKTYSEGKDKDGKEKTLIREFEYEDDITILFNPWCKDDGVYMATEKLLDEYILNECGCVWRGNGHQIGAKEWNFGQFEEDILEICLHLVRSAFRPDKLKALSNPIQVSRMIAKMVNSSQDKGVLSGRWDGKYEDGTAPGKWVGSVKILKQWRKSGPVKYGQCWVFSCITTTVCRALGIPCRTVTNFSSAHDTDESNSIEKYFERDGRVDEEIQGYRGCTDSVWNFHVWNEAWMARPDLEPEYPYGWQVIDATPQEASEGIYTCGPCPVAAIKRGMCSVQYDAGFIFSEVNADEVHWRVHADESLERIEVFKKKIGMKISTKKPTGEDFEYGEGWRFDRDKYADERRLDLTQEYKFPEGSEEEREAVMNAHKTARKPKLETYMEKEKVKPVDFHLFHDNNAMIGSKMVIEFKAHNSGKHDRKISVAVITVAPAAYTGESGKIFHRRTFQNTSIKKGEDTVFGTVIEPDEYLSHLVEQASVKIIATAYVESVGDEEEELVRKEHIVRFRRPDLIVQGQKKVHLGENAVFTVSFTNPLEIPLTGCCISMESAGFQDFDDVPVIDVQAKETFSQEYGLEAILVKKHAAVYFSFDCKEIPDISGMATLQINP